MKAIEMISAVAEMIASGKLSPDAAVMIDHYAFLEQARPTASEGGDLLIFEDRHLPYTPEKLEERAGRISRKAELRREA